MLTEREIERRETLTWCAGLPFVEDRLLRPDERDGISQMAWRLLWQGLASIVMPLFLAPLFMATFGYGCAHGSSPLLDGIFVTLAILSVFLLLLALAAPFASNGWLQRSQSLFGDLRRGYVRKFTGPLNAAIAKDQTIRQLLEYSILDRNAAQRLSLEALPISRRLWRVNGAECRRWFTASWVEVAKLPFQTLLGSLPADISALPGARKLSCIEQKELLRHGRGYWLKPLLPAVAFTFWAGLILFGMLLGPLPTGKVWWDFVDVAITAIAFDIVLAHGIRGAWKLRQDAHGTSVEVHLASSQRCRGYFRGRATPGVLFGSRRLRRDAVAWFEILPVSGRQWTQDGQPSVWRRVKRPDE